MPFQHSWKAKIPRISQMQQIENEYRPLSFLAPSKSKYIGNWIKDKKNG